MKKLCGRVFAAIFTFTLGVVLGAGGLNSRQASVPSLNTSAAPSPSTNSDTSQNSVDSCFVLIDDNDFHPKLNGWNLPLSTEPLSDDEIDGVKLIPLSRGRSLVGVGETLDHVRFSETSNLGI